jgi:membrane protein insertase Oxa1/YidC/SpoIIIJ
MYSDKLEVKKIIATTVLVVVLPIAMMVTTYNITVAKTINIETRMDELEHKISLIEARYKYNTAMFKQELDSLQDRLRLLQQK